MSSALVVRHGPAAAVTTAHVGTATQLTVDCAQPAAAAAPNFLFSSGFGGAAAIVAAVIALIATRLNSSTLTKNNEATIKATAEREAEERRRRADALRRRLRAEARSTFDALVRLFECPEPTEAQMLLECIANLEAQILRDECADLLDETQFDSFHKAVARLRSGADATLFKNLASLALSESASEERPPADGVKLLERWSAASAALLANAYDSLPADTDIRLVRNEALEQHERFVEARSKS